MKHLLLISVLLSLLFLSCKKEEKNKTDCGKNITSISGSYALIKTEYAPTGGSFSEKPVPECMRGDQLILNPDGTTLYNDLGISCSENRAITGTWSVSSDATITILAGGTFGYMQDVSITSFDCSLLVITGSLTGQTFRFSLKK